MFQAASIDSNEVAQFSRQAAVWWDVDGPMRPLHKLNPARLGYIRSQAQTHFRTDSLKGLSVLDIGCGAGLLCEPLARQGAQVTGLDASAEAIEAARAHAQNGRLKISYVEGSAESYAQGGKQFDVITALEIVEHVADLGSFLAAVSRLVKPGGLVILSTLNRNAKSFLFGIVAAEYVLRWVPRGTHDWRKFIKPSELAAHLHKTGLEVSDIAGMQYDPLNDCFGLRPDNASVNYLISAVMKKG